MVHQVLKAAGLAAGAVTLFTGSYVGFAKMNGADMNQLVLLGNLFEVPEESEAEPVQERAPLPQVEPTVRPASIAVFDLFRLDAPFSTTELAALVSELKQKHRDADRRLGSLAQGEERLDDREQAMDDRRAALEDLRSQLEGWEAELAAREAEVNRDEQASAAREQERWQTLAKLFEDGEPEDLSARLLEYAPEEAARILEALSDDQARAILDAMPEAQWKPYADAFSAGAP